MRATLFNRIGLSAKVDRSGWWLDDQRGRHHIPIGLLLSVGLKDEHSTGLCVSFLLGPVMLAFVWRRPITS
jgi:hypothetical protein